MSSTSSIKFQPQPEEEFDSSKENEGSITPHRGGRIRRDGGKSRRSSAGGWLVNRTPHPNTNTISNSPNNRNGNGIYIDTNTTKAIETEVDNLPLPATLSNICILLHNSKDVLTAHADAGYNNVMKGSSSRGNNKRNNDDEAMQKLEIMANLSLSPAKGRGERREEFRDSCASLIPGGNKNLLNTWEEVKKELRAVFLFAPVDIKLPPDDGKDEEGGDGLPIEGGSIARLPRKTPTKKVPPKRASSARRSPKKSRNSRGSKQSAWSKTGKKAEGSFMNMSAFSTLIRNSMGRQAYNKIFHHAEVLITKESSIELTSVTDAAAARLDEQIAQKEAQRRSTQRTEALLAAKEKADKEREAKESASKLLRQLTPEEQHIILEAMEGIGNPAEILQKSDADSVQRGSMQTLRDGQWLNDEVINYFLKNCLAKRDELLCAKQPGRKRSHFFNSFFVQTLFDEKNNNPNLRGKFSYKNVKRWSKKVPGKDIFNLKYIFCPINLDNMHWTSAVIFMEEKKIQYFDSMGGTDMSKLEGLLQYLKDEHKAKKGGEMNVDEWELVRCTRDTPRQRNGKRVDISFSTCVFSC